VRISETSAVSFLKCKGRKEGKDFTKALSTSQNNNKGVGVVHEIKREGNGGETQRNLAGTGPTAVVCQEKERKGQGKKKTVGVGKTRVTSKTVRAEIAVGMTTER